MSPPETHRDLRDRIAALEAALEWALHEATTDALTDCLNRRGWERTLESEEHRCERHDLDAVVVAVDVVGLKAVNDREGHPAGDAVLRSCGDALRSAVRSEDVVARTGGDEFAVLAVHTAEGADTALTARLDQAFASVGVRVAVGCTRRMEAGTLRSAWERADARMVRNKRRTRVTRR